MKKIINGKRRYNTATATLIGMWQQGKPTDEDYMVEALYRKRNGEFFLHGKGGAQTRYAARTKAQWDEGELITPLTVAQAQAWAKEHLTPEEYENAWGEIKEEPDTKKTWTIKVHHSTVERIRRYAGEHKKSLSQAVEDAINSYLKG